jgi:hypothetical protein
MLLLFLVILLLLVILVTKPLRRTSDVRVAEVEDWDDVTRLPYIRSVLIRRI